VNRVLAVKALQRVGHRRADLGDYRRRQHAQFDQLLETGPIDPIGDEVRRPSEIADRQAMRHIQPESAGTMVASVLNPVIPSAGSFTPTRGTFMIIGAVRSGRETRKMLPIAP
jgi:hypothetical protein